MRLTWAFVLGSLLSAAGCDDGPTGVVTDAGVVTDTSAERPICDGTNEIRFLFTTARLWSGPGEVIFLENGAGLVIVDGKCQFWAQGERRWDDLKTGQLSPDEERELAERIRYAEWPSVKGVWPGNPTNYDVPVLRFSDGRNTVECVQDCDLPETPAAVLAMRDQIGDLARWLLERGASATGPVRIMVEENGPEGPSYTVPMTVAWPLQSVSPAEVAIPVSSYDVLTGAGNTTLVTDAADAAALRALREDYRSEKYGVWFYDFIPIRVHDPGADKVPEYLLWFRDTTPFEDERGLIDFPPQ